MSHRVYSVPTLQHPTPCDSQSVSPVSPCNPLFQSDDYLLHLETLKFDHKAREPWMHCDGPANDTLYSSTSTQSTKMSFEAVVGEHQASGKLSKIDASMAISNGPLHIQASMADLQFQVFQVNQPQLDNVCNMDSSWSQCQPLTQAGQQITLNSQLSASEIPKRLAIAMPAKQASQSPELPKLSQKVKCRRKRSPSPPHASTSSSTSPPRSPHTRRVKVRKASHIAIEKRYRTNLSEKLALLRDCIPSLRVRDNEPSSCDATPSTQDTLRSSKASRNLKKVMSLMLAFFGPSLWRCELTDCFSVKATIYTKATEHIRRLEVHNAYLFKEWQELRVRMEACESLLAGRAEGAEGAEEFLGGLGGCRYRWPLQGKEV